MKSDATRNPVCVGVAGVPIGLTNVLTALFALVGRRLDYRAIYSKYTDIDY
jgi:hypothetical protein